MLHARVIVNPIAGAGRTAKKWQQIMVLLRGIGLCFDYDLTEAPGNAIELAKSATKRGYKLVVSVGGDGTINEIVNVDPQRKVQFFALSRNSQPGI